MSKPDRGRVIHFAEAQASIPGPDGQRALSLLRHGSLEVKLSRPLPPNQQTPHLQDEIYIIICGRGVLVTKTSVKHSRPGICVFVAAGTEHHFEDFSEDLAVWVVFYGPSGGEGQPDRGYASAA